MSDIDKDIGKSQLNKLMGVEEKEEHISGMEWGTDDYNDSLFDLDNPPHHDDEILDIPDVLKRQAYDDRKPRKKQKVAKRKSFFDNEDDVPATPGVDTPSTDNTHSLDNAEVEWIVQDCFEAIMKPFDENNVVVQTEDYDTIRKWLKSCLLRGIILDPETNTYKNIKERRL
jgi:hypothetical protein